MISFLINIIKYGMFFAFDKFEERLDILA